MADTNFLDEISNSFNNRKMTSLFYLSKNNKKVSEINLDSSRDLDYEDAAALISPSLHEKLRQLHSPSIKKPGSYRPMSSNVSSFA